VLPPHNRLRRRRDHQMTTRRGVRSGGGLVVVHLLPGAAGETRPTRVGFVVSRSVGAAVTRNTVRRRLRHLMTQRLERVPAGSLVIVRAQSAAATASSAVLGSDLDVALERTLAAGGRAVVPVSAVGGRR
jgi:ribonuclease P protein component